MNRLSPLRVIALAIGCASIVLAQDAHCGTDAPCGGAVVYYQREPVQPSWIFARSTYTHDPLTGARVAQYMRPAPVEPLDDPRIVTSRYRRVRTNLRGTDGSYDTTYDVQSWGNGRGGLDAEWQNFHDAWKESFLTGGFYNQQNPGFGGGFPGSEFGPGFQHGGHGFPNNFPNHGFGNGGAFPGHGFPNGFGGPQHGGHWNGNGPQGGWMHDGKKKWSSWHGSGKKSGPKGHGGRKD
jgi:hypothetical protein